MTNGRKIYDERTKDCGLQAVVKEDGGEKHITIVESGPIDISVIGSDVVYSDVMAKRAKEMGYIISNAPELEGMDVSHWVLYIPHDGRLWYMEPEENTETEYHIGFIEITNVAGIMAVFQKGMS